MMISTSTVYLSKRRQQSIYVQFLGIEVSWPNPVCRCDQRPCRTVHQNRSNTPEPHWSLH